MTDTSFKPTRHHIPHLDGLRALAVLLVLWSHLPIEALLPAAQYARQAIQPGFLGVDVFFVLSGFLITRILLFDKVNGKSLSGFLKRRFLRIFPIYYLTCLLLLFILPGLYILWSALYVSNFVFSFDLSNNPLRHTWSLCVEEHFYLVWPFLVYKLSHLRCRQTACGLLIGGFVVAFALAALDGFLPSSDLIYRITFVRMASLALGSCFAFWERPITAEEVGRKLGWILFVVGIVLLGATMVIDQPWRMAVRVVAFSSISGLFVLTAIRPSALHRMATPLLVNPVMSFIGRISYGIYLYHLPIFFFLHVEEKPAWTTMAAAVAATFAVAATSFYLIEKPLLAKGSKKPASQTA